MLYHMLVCTDLSCYGVALMKILHGSPFVNVKLSFYWFVLN
jgi:hypothetical protein